MSKTPEQVARDAAMEAMAGDSISLVCVSALRSAGLLRDENEPNADDYQRTIFAMTNESVRLTRERDEARERAERSNKSYLEYAEKVRELHEQVRAIKAVHARATEKWDEERIAHEAFAAKWALSAASPEMLRVVDAAKALLEYWDGGESPSAIDNFRLALKALAASQQPKAQEPRYRVVYVGLHTPCPWAVFGSSYESQHSRRDNADAECARLNAAERAK